MCGYDIDDLWFDFLAVIVLLRNVILQNELQINLHFIVAFIVLPSIQFYL